MQPQNNNFEFIATRLFEKYGRGVLTFQEGIEELGYQTEKAGYSALARGRFPVKVTPRGGRKTILVSNLARFLIDGVIQSQCEVSLPEGVSRRGPGRPSKKAQVEARRQA